MGLAEPLPSNNRGVKKEGKDNRRGEGIPQERGKRQTNPGFGGGNGQYNGSCNGKDRRKKNQERQSLYKTVSERRGTTKWGEIFKPNEVMLGRFPPVKGLSPHIQYVEFIRKRRNRFRNRRTRCLQKLTKVGGTGIGTRKKKCQGGAKEVWDKTKGTKSKNVVYREGVA